jgi:hypothetical protein
MQPATSILLLAALATPGVFAAETIAAPAGPVVEAASTANYPAVETKTTPDPARAESQLVADALATKASEVDQLRSKLAQAEDAKRALAESLAVANGEAEQFKRQYSELKLRMEALGLESANPDRRGLEQRVLQAVSDLRIEREEVEKLRDQLVRLAEAMLPYLAASTAEDAELRVAVEEQMRQAAELAYPMPERAKRPDGSLTDARVVSVKDEWSLIVGNLGEKEGVKIGMPFRVVRSGEEIAQVRVVEVRDRVFGAVVQTMAGEDKVNVGDKLQVVVK